MIKQAPENYCPTCGTELEDIRYFEFKYNSCVGRICSECHFMLPMKEIIKIDKRCSICHYKNKCKDKGCFFTRDFE